MSSSRFKKNTGSSSRSENNTKSQHRIHTRESVALGLYNSNRDIFHECNDILDYNTLRTMIQNDCDWSNYRCKQCSLHIYNYITELVKERKLGEYIVEY